MEAVNAESIIRARPFMCKAIIENNIQNMQRIFKANFPIDEPV